MEFEITTYGALKEAWACISADLEGLPEGLVFDSRLALCELVVNALRYGGGRAFVHAERRGGEVLISVRSENGYRPPERSQCPSAESERGRGLFLVDALCAVREFSEEEGVRIVLRPKERAE